MEGWAIQDRSRPRTTWSGSQFENIPVIGKTEWRCAKQIAGAVEDDPNMRFGAVARRTEVVEYVFRPGLATGS